MSESLIRKKEKDSGASDLPVALIIMGLVIAIFAGIIDASIYFTNRGNVQSFADSGARSVALMGGDGNATQATPIERQYGQLRDRVCNSKLSLSPVVKNAYRDDLSNIECSVLSDIAAANNLIQVKVSKVECGIDSAARSARRPILKDKSTAITDRAMCIVDWQYNGIPGSTMSLMRKRDDETHKSNGLFFKNETVGTSETEVKLDGVELVDR